MSEELTDSKGDKPESPVVVPNDDLMRYFCKLAMRVTNEMGVEQTNKMANELHTWSYNRGWTNG